MNKKCCNCKHATRITSQWSDKREWTCKWNRKAKESLTEDSEACIVWQPREDKNET
jgi:hypothetical protein